MKKLYYIENVGCDDTTHGLAEFTDQEFELFLNTVKNLNKNSTYDCMPKISIYEICWDDIVEYDPDAVGYHDKLYFGDKIYTLKDWHELFHERETPPKDLAEEE